MVDSAPLQYGALGLAAILAALFVKYINDREADRKERDRAIEAQREKDAQFIKDLVLSSIAANEASELAFRKLAEEGVRSSDQIASALDKLCVRLDASEGQHAEMLAAIHGLAQPGAN